MRGYLPKMPKYMISAPLSASFTIPVLQRFMTSLRVTDYIWEGNIGVGAVNGNVWSRAARRKGPASSDLDDIKLGFRITVRDTNDGSEISIEWRIGTDVILFESFCGKIKEIVRRS